MKYKFFSLLFFPFVLFAQSNYRSPVDFSIGLSGTFGELRTNHFHTGIDIRTQQKVGKGKDEVRISYVLNAKDLHASMEILAVALENYPGRTV